MEPQTPWFIPPYLTVIIQGILFHDRHGNGSLGVGHILFFPHLCDGLDLGVEVDALFAVEVHVSAEGSSWASEGEHREGNGDGDVDANLQGEEKNQEIY